MTNHWSLVLWGTLVLVQLYAAVIDRGGSVVIAAVATFVSIPQGRHKELVRATLQSQPPLDRACGRTIGQNAYHEVASTAVMRSIPKDDLIVGDTSLDDFKMTRAPPCRRHVMAAVSVAAMSLAGTAPVLQLGVVQPAYAAYGDSTNIALPSYIDFLLEKNAVADPSTFLYQGADRTVQLQRLAVAQTRLESIPAICGRRQWSQVDGVLTGPLGTLVPTMKQIAGSANVPARAAAGKVQADLLAIRQAATRKDGALCVAASESAQQSLQVFVQEAF
jgi:hypothetical protein